MRRAVIKRRTKESSVNVELNLDGSGICEAKTPFSFLNHMLSQLAFYSLIDIRVAASGDLSHHVIEDAGIALGEALRKTLKEKGNIVRYGYAIIPMDDALVLVSLDLGGRVYSRIMLNFSREIIEDTPTEDLIHFLKSFADSARMNLHVYQLAGENDHHIAEAVFKALGFSLRTAIKVDERRKGDVTSTKGVL